jgi:PAS domain S-box-containing protein
MAMSSHQDASNIRLREPIRSMEDAQFRQILEALPAAVYATDAEGRLTYFNEAAVELWGRRPTLRKEWWCGSWRLFWPDGSEMPHDECPMATTIKTGKPIRGVEAIAARPDGTRYTFLPFPTPLRDETGKLIGAVNLLVDVSDRKKSEMAAQRLAAIVESSEDAIVSKDLNGIIATWNASAERIFGYKAEEVIGKSITILIPPDHLDEEPRLLERIRRGERVDHFETVRRRKDGSLIPISLTLSPIRDAYGRIVGASKIARDNSERKRADERQQILLGEMRHRAGNLAALITALASQSRPKNSPEIDQYIDRFLGRMRSLLAAGELVLASSSRTPNLDDIVRTALKPFVDMYGQARIVTSGPSLAITEQMGAAIALAMHELGTNAVKYGALSRPEGSLTLSWKITPQQSHSRVEIEWRERGGPDVRAPEKPGFGTRVIRSTMSGAKDGTVSLDFAHEGLCCRMSFLAAKN